MFEKSEEFNSCAAGLGIFKGSVIRFSEKHGLKIPQIGWNQLEIVKPDCPLFRGVANGSYVYFVHSFYPQPVDAGIVATRTEYGDTFASSVWRDNVYATQFHPEKSQKVGLQLLKNFVELANADPPAHETDSSISVFHLSLALLCVGLAGCASPIPGGALEQRL